MRALVLSATIFAGLALSAQAQEDVLTLSAPSVSETEQAQPDWYQQFTFDTNVSETPVWQATPTKTFKLGWVKGDRWNLTVDLTSREGQSPLPREEMSAGANFFITPRLSVGGEVSFGANELEDTSAWQDQELETGIRLRSALKF
ncbi:MAG: NtrZ family periplasmic regulatory protein [Pseudomonadota bacterium]